MFQPNDEKIISRLIAIGATITSLIVLTGTVSDPVNAPKLFILGGLAFGLVGILAGRTSKINWSQNILLNVLVGIFFVGMIIATFFSKSPFTQNLYGTYGRNTGFFAYLFLGLILVATAGLRNLQSFKLVMGGLFLTGVVNVIYAIWTITFGDPVNWENPYGALLGTFGNPNFISSFLGLFSAVVVAYAVQDKIKIIYRILSLGLLLLNTFLISKTDSIQGYVVTAACLGLILFMRIKGSKFSKFSWFFLFGLFLGAAMAIAGVFKIGPLAKFLYQGTMAFREQYWKAAINMAMAHPLTGVGMDSYGDNYRLYRDIKALTTPGVSVVANAPHNVVLEFFASGGVLLLISYALILILALVSVVRILKRVKKYDFIFSALTSAWVGYQLQSLISINQLGLAIWGWILTGALVGYEYATREEAEVAVSGKVMKSNQRSKQSESVLSSGLLAGVGCMIGFLLAAPAISADMAWVSSTKSGNYIQVQNALKPTYLHPQESSRLVQFVQMLENSKLNDQARIFALQATSFNPNNADSWRILYLIKNSTPEEKSEALKNLKRLDPLNPDPARN